LSHVRSDIPYIYPTIHLFAAWQPCKEQGQLALSILIAVYGFVNHFKTAYIPLIIGTKQAYSWIYFEELLIIPYKFGNIRSYQIGKTKLSPVGEADFSHKISPFDEK